MGGSEIHSKNGAIDIVVKSEEEAIETAKSISFLPSSVYELPPREKNKDDPNRKDEWLISAIPKDRRKVYKSRKIIETSF